MVKIPSADSLNRRIPTYSGTVHKIPVNDEMARALQEGGRNLSDLSNALISKNRAEKAAEQKRNQEMEKLNIARYNSEFKSRVAELQDSISTENDYSTYHNKYDEGIKNLRNNLSHLRNSVSPIGQQYIDIKQNELESSGNLKIQGLVRDKQKDNSLASFEYIKEQSLNLYSRTGDRSDLESAETALSTIYNAGFISKEDYVTKKIELEKTANLNYINSLSDKDKLSIITGGKVNTVTKDEDHWAKLAYLESRFDVNAKNTESSAGGVFQFIDGTAKQYGVKNKFDVKESFNGVKKFDKDNVKHFKKVLGREPEGWERYLLHQQGMGGATKLLKNANKKAIDVVGKDEVLLNGGNINMTAREFANLWRDKYEAAPTVAPDHIMNVIREIPIADNQYTSAIPADDLRKIANSSHKTIKDEIKAIKEKEYSDKYSSIVAGDFDQKNIDQWLFGKEITPTQHKNLSSVLKKRNAAELKEIESQQKINALENAVVGSKLHKEGATELFSKNVIPYLNDPEITLAGKVVLLDRAIESTKGFVPKEMKDVLNGMMFSSLNNPEDKQGQLVGEFVNLAKNSPFENSFYQLDPKLQRYGTLYKHFRESGNDEMQAANLASQAIKNSPKIEQIEKQMSSGDEKKFLDTINFRDESYAIPFMDTLYQIEEGTDLFYQVNGDYKNKYIAYRMTGMNVSEAKEAAFGYLEAHYNVMPTGNYSKYPIAQEQQEFVMGEITEMLRVKNPSMLESDWQLIADDMTDKQAKSGQILTYQILNDEGLPLIDKNGNIIRYIHNSKNYDEYLALERAEEVQDYETRLDLAARMYGISKEEAKEKIDAHIKRKDGLKNWWEKTTFNPWKIAEEAARKTKESE